MSGIKQRYIEEAAAKNLTISSCISGTRFVFQRNSCGHTFEDNISNVRHSSKTLCKKCTDEAVEAAELRHGITFVEKLSNIKNKYIINSCGHSVALYKSNLVKNKSLICPECEFNKLNANLEKQGLELVEYRTGDDLDVSKINKVAKIRYKNCGHEVNRYRSFKKDYGPCEICAENNKNIIYSNNGLSFISKINSVKSLFRFNSCGHERVIYNSAAIRGNCLCQECNESSFNKKSKIYIIEILTDEGNKFIKLGYGKDIPNRVREYRMKRVKEYKVLFEKSFDSGTDAMLVEKSVHKSFKDAALPADYARTYLTRGGFTECYPVNLFDKIVKEISSKEKELIID